MVRWGQASISADLLAAAKSAVRPDLYEAARADNPAKRAPGPADGIGAFTGPRFDPNDIAGYLAGWTIKRSR